VRQQRGCSLLLYSGVEGEPSVRVERWKVKSQRFPVQVWEPFSAEFAFEGKAFWADYFTQGCLLYSGSVADFDHVFCRASPASPGRATRPQRAEQDDPDSWLRRGLRLVCIHRADDLLVTSTLNRFPCRTVAATQVCGHT
jgi:hypothetical protein